MNPRSLTTPLVAAALLLSTLGCSKKDDPTPDPTPTPTAGYTLNNQAVKCTAAAIHTTSNGADFLVLTFTTAPQPASGPQVLTLTLTKQLSDPVTNYQTVGSNMTVTTTTGTTTTPYGTTTAAVYSTATGGLSGGFATYLTTPPNATITGGYFTDVIPK